MSVAWQRDTDGTLRISINPRPGGGYTLSTAYLGWKLVEAEQALQVTL